MRVIGTLILAISALSLSIGSSQAERVFTQKCPKPDNDVELTNWRERLFTQFLAHESPNPRQFQSSVSECFPKKIPACLVRAESYFGERGQGTLFSRDVQLLDPEAKDDIRKQMPKELLTSDSKDLNYVFRADVEKVAKDLGWPAVKYKSRHSGGFDRQTSSLLMIEVPGASLNPPVTYDRFINIALPKDDHDDATEPSPQKSMPDPKVLEADARGTYPTTTTMVTVDRSKTGPNKILFQRYYRNKQFYSPATGEDVSNQCLSCHSSGLRPISPLGYGVDENEKQLSEADWGIVNKINTDMTSLSGGKMDWGKVKTRDGHVISAVDPNRYGAIIGPAVPLTKNIVFDKNGKQTVTYPTRTEDYIMGKKGMPGCATKYSHISLIDIFNREPGRKNIYEFTSYPPVSWRKVAEAMNCQSCHNGNYRGVLNAKTDMGMVKYKILVDKAMPDGMHMNPLQNGGPNKSVTDDLNLNERIALANCLESEFWSESVNNFAWLTEVPCNEHSKPDDAKKATNLFKRLIHPDLSCPR